MIDVTVYETITPHSVCVEFDASHPHPTRMLTMLLWMDVTGVFGC